LRSEFLAARTTKTLRSRPPLRLPTDRLVRREIEAIIEELIELLDYCDAGEEDFEPSEDFEPDPDDEPALNTEWRPYFTKVVNKGRLRREKVD
jgi:hypothetical protein